MMCLNKYEIFKALRKNESARRFIADDSFFKQSNKEGEAK